MQETSVSILESSIPAPQIRNNPVSPLGAMAWSATGDVVRDFYFPQRKSPKMNLPDAVACKGSIENSTTQVSWLQIL